MTRTAKLLPVLPVERALKAIAGRWKAVVLYHLLSGTKRLTDLQQLMPGCSQKVLIQQLRDLEAHGLVQRRTFADAQRVDYSPTPLGLSLEPLLLALCEWGQRHAAELDELDRITDCIIKPVHTAGLNARH